MLKKHNIHCKKKNKKKSKNSKTRYIFTINVSLTLAQTLCVIYVIEFTWFVFGEIVLNCWVFWVKFIQKNTSQSLMGHLNMGISMLIIYQVFIPVCISSTNKIEMYFNLHLKPV